MKDGKLQTELVIGALVVLGVFLLLRYVVGARGHAGISAGGASINAAGDISLPSAVGAGIDVSVPIATELQTATSPDGKYDTSFDLAVDGSLYAIPASSL